MAINSNTESWNNHTFAEVEAHIKNRFNEAEYNGHAYVEIGGKKWATMNIGANSVTEIGQYFQWGDTTGYYESQVGNNDGQKKFIAKDYKFNTDNTTTWGSTTKKSKYNNVDGKTTLDLCDDAARANWGGQWRIPTRAEYTDLISSTTQTFTSNYLSSGRAGVIFTDKTDSSKVLFFPFSSLAYNSEVDWDTSEGYDWSYWTRDLLNALQAYYVEFYEESGSLKIMTTSTFRVAGSTIRPIIDN